MKPTPRTDAEWPEGSFVDGKDALKFARDLERQLSEALEREAKLRQELADIDRRATEYAALNDRQSLLDAACQKNAARYLFLRDRGWPFSFKGETAADADAAIDNAIDQAESGDEPTYTDCPIHGRHEGDCPRC